MTYGIRIKGLKEVQSMLGQDFAPTIRTATNTIALEVQGKVAPYPPATIASSPRNPTGKWYQRNYGPKWRRKDGSIGGRATSQMMSKKWSVEPRGRIGWVIGNAASYAKYLHSAQKQARWAGLRGWHTDKEGVENIVNSGRARQIIVQEIMRAFKKRRR